MSLSHRLLAALLVFGLTADRAFAQTPRALNPADVDTACKPCQNFYRFATGGWERATPIPASAPAWSSFDELTQRNYRDVRAILEDAARTAERTSSSDQRKLGRFYATCMDTAAIESADDAPIRADLARIRTISTRPQLRAAIVALQRDGFTLVHGFGSEQDARNSSRVIMSFTQGGLGLPDRDYYFKQDSSTRAVRDAYRRHVAALLRLTGSRDADVAAQSDSVLAIETALAEGSLNRLQQRDPNARYHLMSLAAADTLAPSLFRPTLESFGLATTRTFNVAHPAFFAALGRTLGQRSLESWRLYLRVRVAANAAPWLSRRFADESFRMTQVLTGAREPLPRWRRCLATTDRYLTDPLGRKYVETAFTPAAKATMNGIVDNLLAVYDRRLRSVPWMSEATRAQALRKLGTIKRKLGYPDTWRDYGALRVDRSGWFANFRRAVAFDNRRDLSKVGKAVDRGEWPTTAPTVNAFYIAQNNEIVFPAGRLQPPFFHPSFDLAANYGGVAATIGHEISHGFDDQGRKFDADGNLRDWWTADDAARFGQLADLIDKQYSAYSPAEGLLLNGRQTLGENIADNAGVSIAYEAMQLALKDAPRDLIDGFTPEQRFFLAWAQARRQVWRPEALRLTVQTGVHSPGEFRVNGPLSNMPEFAAAFGCRSGDAMVRGESRIRIW